MCARPLADALDRDELGDDLLVVELVEAVELELARRRRARPASAGSATFARESPAAARSSSGSAARTSSGVGGCPPKCSSSRAVDRRARRRPTAAGRRSSARARRSGRRRGPRRVALEVAAGRARRAGRASTGSARAQVRERRRPGRVSARPASAGIGSPSSALSARSSDARDAGEARRVAQGVGATPRSCAGAGRGRGTRRRRRCRRRRRTPGRRGRSEYVVWLSTLRVLAADLDVLLHDPPALVGAAARTTRASSRTGRRTGTCRGTGAGTRRCSSEYSEPLRIAEERVRLRAPLHQPALGEHDVELVDAVEVLGLGDEHQVGVAAGADEREAPAAGGRRRSPRRRRGTRACRSRALGRVQAPPGGVDLQERVLDEVTVAHGTEDTPVASDRFPVPGPRARVRARTLCCGRLAAPDRAGRVGSMRCDAHRPGVAVLVDVPGRSDPAHRGARGAVPPRGPRRARASRLTTRPTASRRGCTAAPARSRARRPTGSSRSGRTIGVESNGAVSNLAPTPYALTTLRKELRAMRSDVIHVHEPAAPTVGYDALDATVAPLVGTFHCYSENAFSHGIANGVFGVRRKLQRLQRPHRGLRGRRVDRAALLRRPLPRHPQRRRRPGRDPREGPGRRPAAAARVRRPGGRAQGPARPAARLRGAARARPGRARRRRRRRGGRRPAAARPDAASARSARSRDERKHAALESADLLVAPSLGGESFGMVLTEGFAAGTPVVASDIAGYRDVVHDGEDGVLVPRGDPTALAETLRDLALDPARRAAHGREAPRPARERYAWPTVAAEVLGAYEDAVAMPAPATSRERDARVPRVACPPTGSRRSARSACRASSPSRPRRARRLRVFARRAAIARRRGSAAPRCRGSPCSGSASTRSARASSPPRRGGSSSRSG